MPRSSLFASLALSTCLAASAQTHTAPVKTHVVNADGSVTFSISAPNAKTATVRFEGKGKPFAMTEDANGVWSVTTPALKPQIYNYNFVIDGQLFPDPRNPDLHDGFGPISSLVTVPGTPPMPWELTDIPHGEITIHNFTTHVAQNLPQNQSAYAVYTPPNYDAKKKGGYPVLYLLHGYYDSYDGWIKVGRSNRILDSLIAQGKAVPMIVVTTLGYGDWHFMVGPSDNWDDQGIVNRNTDLYTQELETEVMPAVEHEYNTATDRNHRAIAGLSMGGLETIQIGLTHSQQFAYVAAFSAAIPDDAHLAGLDGKKANFKLLWDSVGVDDDLLPSNRDFVTWARSKGYTVNAVETPGAHQWTVWRENLVSVLPLLFR